jgi:uncharacterized membrane protein
METKIRTVVKSLTFRVIAFSVTAPFVGVTVAVGLQVFLLCAYYVHERLWMRVKWGKEPFFNG